MEILKLKSKKSIIRTRETKLRQMVSRGAFRTSGSSKNGDLRFSKKVESDSSWFHTAWQEVGGRSFDRSEDINPCMIYKQEGNFYFSESKILSDFHAPSFTDKYITLYHKRREGVECKSIKLF